MMLGERSYGGTGNLRFPPWSFTGDNRNSFSVSPNDGRTTAKASVDDHYSAFSKTHSLTAPLHDLYLSSNYGNDAVGESQFPDSIINGSGDIHDILVPVDAQSCDQFRMFEFKLKTCSRAKSHEWTDCPFAHPAENARRRDPRKYHYSGTACPDFRTGSCPRGDACEFAHGVFEHWLHPARYRTQPCKDGMSCKRRVCFFAHWPDQLRVLSPRAESYDGSPLRVASVSSPETVSPPISPMAANSVYAMGSSLRQLQLNKVMSMPNSPRVKIMTPPGYTSLPTTPTRSFNPVAEPGM